MPRSLIATACAVVVCLVPALRASGPERLLVPEPLSRSVYVVVTDDKGQPVPGLTPADFVLKEGGKEREISKVERATARPRIALLVEEALTAVSYARKGIFDFCQLVMPAAEVSLVKVGLRNVTVQEYTTDINAIVAAVNKFALNATAADDHMAEGIFEAAKAMQTAPAPRPIIVSLALETSQSSAERPEQVMEELRKSRALLEVVAVSTGNATGPADIDTANRGQVLGDGSKQTGGRRISVTASLGIPGGMQQAAADIAGQYLITYVLPDGVKPADRISVTTKRKGITLRAPSRVMDK